MEPLKASDIIDNGLVDEIFFQVSSYLYNSSQASLPYFVGHQYINWMENWQFKSYINILITPIPCLFSFFSPKIPAILRHHEQLLDDLQRTLTDDQVCMSNVFLDMVKTSPLFIFFFFSVFCSISEKINNSQNKSLHIQSPIYF